MGKMTLNRHVVRVRVALVAAFVAVVVCVSSLSAAPSSAAEPSWPVFHGPKGDNISPETGLLDSWPENGPKLLWKCDKLGDDDAGYSGVTVVDGALYTSGMVIEDDTAYSVVFCLDAENGNVLWTYKNGLCWNEKGKYPGTRSTPTVDGNYVYDESSLGQLVCLDRKTGQKIWDRNILTEFEAENITWALAESVVVDGGNLICTPGGKKAGIVALNKNTGEVVWTTPSTGQKTNYATPYLFEFEGRKIIAAMNEKGVLGVDAKTGELLFSAEHVTRFDINATMPYYENGCLFVTSGYGTGAQCFKLVGDAGKITLEKLWENKRFDNQHGGVVVVDGYVYGTTMGGRWACLNLADGNTTWEVRGIGKGSCSYADGKFYGMDESNGYVVLFEKNPEEYREISRFQLPEEGQGAYWAHPVICGKRLYLRHCNFLYCFDIAK